jgi:CheY-like chemotaxis protein
MSDQTILLIDYDPESIERARRPLTDAGYRVEVAKDGPSGLAAFEKLQPGLVLVEAMLPKKHGFEVCQEIKQSESGKETPVVIATAAFRGRRYRTDALRIYGCDEYLEKPLGADELLSICRKFVGEPSKNGDSVGEESAAAPTPEPQPVVPGGVPPMTPMTEQELEERLTEVLRNVGDGRRPRRAAASASASPGPAAAPAVSPAATSSGGGLPPSLDDLSDMEVDARLDALLEEEDEAPESEAMSVEVEVPIAEAAGSERTEVVDEIVADDELSEAAELLADEPGEPPGAADVELDDGASGQTPVEAFEPRPTDEPHASEIDTTSSMTEGAPPDEETLRVAVAEDEEQARAWRESDDDDAEEHTAAPSAGTEDEAPAEEVRTESEGDLRTGSENEPGAEQERDGILETADEPDGPTSPESDSAAASTGCDDPTPPATEPPAASTEWDEPDAAISKTAYAEPEVAVAPASDLPAIESDRPAKQPIVPGPPARPAEQVAAVLDGIAPSGPSTAKHRPDQILEAPLDDRCRRAARRRRRSRPVLHHGQRRRDSRAGNDRLGSNRAAGDSHASNRAPSTGGVEPDRRERRGRGSRRGGDGAHPHRDARADAAGFRAGGR